MNKTKLRVVFKYRSIDAFDAWMCIAQVLEAHKKLSPIYDISGKKRSSEKIHKELEKNPGHFGIEDDNFDFDFVTSGTKYHDIIINPKTPSSIKWDEWICAFHSKDRIVLGRLYEGEYETWQNASSLQYYELNGRSYKGLPMRHNKLPAPLDKMIVDISQNPGRMILRYEKGYIEAVGSTMWLGPLFYERTKASKEDIEKADWLEVKEIAPDLLRVIAQDKCFTTVEGKEGELQNKLRGLLFPEHHTLLMEFH